MTEISASHKSAKKDSYWENLVGGNTAAYKEAVIEQLLERYPPAKRESLLDIGCGTCEVIFKYMDKFAAASATCMDYDPKVINRLQAQYPRPGIRWAVEDVFALKNWKESFDVIFL